MRLTWLALACWPGFLRLSAVSLLWGAGPQLLLCLGRGCSGQSYSRSLLTWPAASPRLDSLSLLPKCPLSLPNLHAV